MLVGGHVGEQVLVSLRQAAKCYSVKGETQGRVLEMALTEKVAGGEPQAFHARASLSHTHMHMCPRIFQPSRLSCHLLTKEWALQREPVPLPCPHLPKKPHLESALLMAANPRGRGLGTIPRMLLALSFWSPFISHVRFNELHAHQPRAITTVTDGSVG